VIGFGPSGISFAANRRFTGALKTLNPESSGDYAAAVKCNTGPWDRLFAYTPRDLRIFYLTRRLAALEIDRAAYRSLFGADPLSDFRREFHALLSAGLVEKAARWVRPTPRGIFYADSIAALLAWRQLRSTRWQGRPGVVAGYPMHRRNENGFGHM
jgi:oxygen-independent coproporphyrinogen-3 oxidase